MEIYPFLHRINNVGHKVEITQHREDGRLVTTSYELLALFESHLLAIFIHKGEEPTEFEKKQSSNLLITSKVFENHQTEVPTHQFTLEGDYVLVKFEKPRIDSMDTAKHMRDAPIYEDEEHRENTRFYIEDKNLAIIDLVEAANGFKLKTLFHDISQGGISFYFPSADVEVFKLDAEIKIRSLAGKSFEDLTARVVNLRSDGLDTGRSLVALQFSEKMNMMNVLEIVRLCKNK